MNNISSEVQKQKIFFLKSQRNKAYKDLNSYKAFITLHAFDIMYGSTLVHVYPKCFVVSVEAV